MLNKLAAIALIGVLVFGAVSFAGSTPVSAQAETYTAPFKLDECYSDPEGSYTICVQSHGVFHIADQPDGDIVSVVNETICSRLSYSGEVSEECSRYHGTLVHRQGEAQAGSFLYNEEATFAGVTCTFGYHIVYANGRPRVVEFDFDCKGLGSRV